jgi:hypothetical protein
MSVPDEASLNAALVGNEPGFRLTFQREVDGAITPSLDDLVISSDDVHGELRAALPDGLTGGTYTFKIERLRDDEYARLSRAVRPEKRLDACTLELFWREAIGGVGSYLAGLVGVQGAPTPSDPIAVLAVVGVSRAVGPRGIETTITCRERLFVRLGAPLCGEPIDAPDLETAIPAVLSRLGIDADTTTYPLGPPPPAAASPGRVTLELGLSGVGCLTRIGDRIEERLNQHGRGMLLLRDGKLHLGPRQIPLLGMGVKPLTAELGLVEAEPLEQVPIDPNFDRCANPGVTPPTRRQYKLTLKGRPDLKPGDVVSFALPVEEAPPSGLAAFGVVGTVAALLEGPGAAGPQMRLYVASVEHRLGRTTGFVTTVTGVELIDGTSDFDVHTPAAAGRAAEGRPTAASADADAAGAIAAIAARAAGDRAALDVGEVRAATQPAQTGLVWRGLAPSDGAGAQAGRLDPQRPSQAPASEVPYLTPFAFGKAGLVLPRYPGTRVAVGHRLGAADDPVAIGALWQAGTAPDNQPGDWWLILPTEADPRDALGDDDVPVPYTGAATNDLIDADGNRVIEVGELTVRVGAPAPAGTRPARADDAGSITIEHADAGSKIVMSADGAILIEAAADLTLKAVNVKVEVSGTMDVGS